MKDFYQMVLGKLELRLGIFLLYMFFVFFAGAIYLTNRKGYH